MVTLIRKNYKIIILFISFGFLLLINPILQEAEEQMLDQEYHDTQNITQNILFLRLFGMKKVGCDFLWVNQVLTITEPSIEGDEASVLIKSNSDKMAFLDPYFITNYTFSGSILGLIKVFYRPDLASKIYETGIYYNPDNQILKKYYAGLIAASNNNTEALLKNFEEIVEETKDDLLTNIVAYLYEKKYKESNDKKELLKAIKYWKLLLTSKEDKYKSIAIRKLKEYR